MKTTSFIFAILILFSSTDRKSISYATPPTPAPTYRLENSKIIQNLAEKTSYKQMFGAITVSTKETNFHTSSNLGKSGTIISNTKLQKLMDSNSWMAFYGVCIEFNYKNAKWKLITRAEIHNGVFKFEREAPLIAAAIDFYAHDNHDTTIKDHKIRITHEGDNVLSTNFHMTYMRGEIFVSGCNIEIVGTHPLLVKNVRMGYPQHYLNYFIEIFDDINNNEFLVPTMKDMGVIPGRHFICDASVSDKLHCKYEISPLHDIEIYRGWPYDSVYGSRYDIEVSAYSKNGTIPRYMNLPRAAEIYNQPQIHSAFENNSVRWMIYRWSMTKNDLNVRFLFPGRDIFVSTKIEKGSQINVSYEKQK